MTLRSTLKNTLATAALALLGATSASAVQIQMGEWQPGSVGHYRANPIGGFENILDNYTLGKSTDGTWFGTFCIEINEYFASGGTYDVEFNNGAISGGKSGAVNGKDIISKGTAWLYEQYAMGTLAGLDFSSKASVKSLQYAIWYLEGEMDYDNSATNLLNLAQTALNLDLTGIKEDYQGTNVQVMNLTSNNGQNQHQDQLVYMPVPDATSTLALLTLSIVGILAISRKLA